MRTKVIHSMVATVLFAMMAVLLGSILTGCSSAGRRTPETKVPAGAVAIAGAGSTFDSILFKTWFTIFEHDNPNTYITYDVVGSGEGVRRFVGKNVNRRGQGRFWR